MRRKDRAVVIALAAAIGVAAATVGSVWWYAGYLAAERARLEELRAELDARLSEYRGDGCTVWALSPYGETQVNTQFRGPGELAACRAFKAWLLTSSITTLEAGPSDAPVVCRGSKGELLFTVRGPSSGTYYWLRICDALIRWARGDVELSAAPLP